MRPLVPKESSFAVAKRSLAPVMGRRRGSNLKVNNRPGMLFRAAQAARCTPTSSLLRFYLFRRPENDTRNARSNDLTGRS